MDLRRDYLAHVIRYLYFCEKGIIGMKKELDRPINILEVGCGHIHFLRTFYKSFIARKTDYINKFVGVDLDENAVEYVNSRYEKLLNICNARIYNLDITGGLPESLEKCFDLIIYSEVMEHLPKDKVQFVMNELSRVLNRDGVIMFSTPNGSATNSVLPKDHVYEYNITEVQDCIEGAGLIYRYRTGIYMKLPNIRPSIKETEAFKTLQRKFDKRFLSMIMSSFCTEESNNILWELVHKRG